MMQDHNGSGYAEMPDRTLAYYDHNAEAFTAGTLASDMGAIRSRFLAALPAAPSAPATPSAPAVLSIPAAPCILDLGCGSGRDAKAFLDLGYRVEASDGSEELCRLASAYTGIPVKHMLFQELSEKERYDGIWACASILHMEKKSLPGMLHRIAAALKPGGILYTSFKYGDFEGMRGGRYFSCFTEETLVSLMAQEPELDAFDIWLTQDVRPGREEEQWINMLAMRRGYEIWQMK